MGQIQHRCTPAAWITLRGNRKFEHKMTSSVVTIFSLAFIVVINQVDSSSLDTDFKANYKLANSFKCLDPQPRSIQLTDLVSDAIKLAGRRYIPRTTVLHRCDSQSGSCLTGNPLATCAPVQTETVKLAFYAINLGPKKPGNVSTEIFTAQNHTRCGCMRPFGEGKK